MQKHAVPGQQDDWQAEIASLEEDANQAFLERDLGRLGEIFSDELVVNSPINLINDKSKILEMLGTGVIGHKEGVRWRLFIRHANVIADLTKHPTRRADA